MTDESPPPTVSPPRLLDLFCGAQGAGEGYHRAGFAVIGVDIEPHPDAPNPVLEANALEILGDREFLNTFDVIHASPPCQHYTTMSNRHRGQGGKADSHPALIPAVRHALERWGGTYVIENVPGARHELRNPIVLRGGMFGLGVDRPRLFETSIPIIPPPTRPQAGDLIGVYGTHHDGRRLWTRADGSILRAARSLEEAQAAMGIDWMQWPDLVDAIPPAYTQCLGQQILEPAGAYLW